jgi:hypothetical protein
MVDSLLGKNGDGGKPRAKSGRLARTIVLGSVAVAFAIYWLARSYGVDMEELITYLKASLAFVAFFALVGILAGAVIWLVRWWRMRS